MDAILQELMMPQFRESYEGDYEQRRDALSDIEFHSGKGQWDPLVEQWRVSQKRPVLTINQMPTFTDQITGDMRQNKSGIIVHPVDELATPQRAAVIEGLIREIEDTSHADIAYLTAGESASICGRGAFRLLTEYESDTSFNQRIKIVRIKNPFSFWFDPNAHGFFLEDARYAFLTTDMGRKTFELEYPDNDPSGFDSKDGETPDNIGLIWNSADTIKVAEWFNIVEEPFTLYQAMIIIDGQEIYTTTDKDKDLPKGMSLVLDKDNNPISRKSKRRKIEWRKVTAKEVIEGPVVWNGKYIPIIPVWGKEVNLGETTTTRGIVRYAKDSQRAYNYASTSHIESIAMAPRAPYVAGRKQIKGFEDQWEHSSEQMNTLFYNDDEPGSHPPRREVPIQSQPGLSAELALRAQELKATTGMFQDNIGETSNATSGVAISNRQRQGQVGNMAYLDNLQKAIAWCGDILVDLIPKIYDPERIVNMITREGKRERIRINSTEQPKTSNANSESEIKAIEDLGKGQYSVTTMAGPSYATARIAAMNAMIEMLRVAPSVAPYIMDLIAENMDWSGAEKLAERLRLLLPPQAQPKKEGEQPDPAQELIMQLQKQKAELEIQLQTREIDKIESEILLNTSKARQIEKEIANGKTETQTSETSQRGV